MGTPLNVVSGRAKLITNEDMQPEEILESARIIQEQTQRMTKIIQQLLNFARRRKPARTPGDINEVLARVIEMLGPLAGKHQVQLQTVSHGKLPLVPIDSDQIQQVLMNIAMNGIQAMPSGGRMVFDICLETIQPPPDLQTGKTTFLVIRVADEGEGITQENLEQIFDPFFTTKDVGKGTGLGLSIVYGIIKEHNGWIEAQSEPGKGTCFSIFLPMEEQR